MDINLIRWLYDKNHPINPHTIVHNEIDSNVNVDTPIHPFETLSFAEDCKATCNTERVEYTVEDQAIIAANVTCVQVAK